MTPPPTTPKRIEKLTAYSRVKIMTGGGDYIILPTSEAFEELGDKVNEIVDIINKLADNK